MNCRKWPAVRASMLLLVVGCVGWLLVPTQAQAAPVEGLFISVPNPIDDRAVQLIKRKVDDAVLTRKRAIQVVVFDFNPENLASATSEYNSANSLAEYILTLRTNSERRYPAPLRTVAFVHEETTRHTVLPVVACEVIYMSDELDARREFRVKLGNVSPDGSDVFNNNIYTAYSSVAVKHAASDLVMRLLDRNLELRQVEYRDGSLHYLSPKSYQQKVEEGEVAKGSWDRAQTPPGLERGRALFDPDQARKFGLIQGIVRDRAGLVAALKLTPRSLVEDHLLDQQIKVAVFQVRGRLDKGTLNDLRNQVNGALRDRHNFLIFQLESSGGDTRDIGSFANWLSELKVNESNLPARTLAYIPPKASIGAATFLALGCQEIVMGPEAFLADFNYLNSKDEEERLRALREMIVPLAEKRGYPAVLFEAALTPGMAIYHVRDQKGEDERFLSEEQFLADKKSDQPRWTNLGRIEAKSGELLRIPTERALNWRIAVDTGAPVNRVEDLYGYFGIDATRITISKPGWLYRIAEFFREPIVNFVLIMVGILGLILELKMPGTTVPGVIAAICFVLFFWSFSFVGEFTMLASLLFVLGLILIGIEVFVLPGFGFTGISGIFLIIFSMVLVTLDNVPQTSAEWVSVGGRITTLGLGLVGGIIGAFVLAHYLPSIPYINRLVLRPPEEEGDTSEPQRGLSPSYAHLLGAIGVAATTLRPAGKAQFGEEFFDVVAEGDYVNPGSRIQVVEIEGYRIVVKEI